MDFDARLSRIADAIARAAYFDIDARFSGESPTKFLKLIR
jgi:hypothetical protein